MTEDRPELPTLAQLLNPEWFPAALPEHILNSQSVGSGFQAQMVVGARSATSEKVRLLNLKATELKAEDIHAAVLCLQEAQALALETGQSGFDARWWLRLPTFLQLAGRMDEAERAFDDIELDLDQKQPKRFMVETAQVRPAHRRALADARQIARDREARKNAPPNSRRKQRIAPAG
jgi:hypothetical protein